MLGNRFPKQGHALPFFDSSLHPTTCQIPVNSALTYSVRHLLMMGNTFAQRKSLEKEVNANGGSTEVYGFLQPGRGG